MPEDEPFLIPAPPPSSEERVPDAVAPPEPIHPPDFITLPPGIVDSGTHRVATPRPSRADRPLSEEVVFFPVQPGIPIPGPDVEQDVEETVVAPRHVARTWSLLFADREPLPIAGPLFVGRNPVVTAGLPGAGLLAITDPEKTLSKTHALLEVDDETFWVTDLHSTNGVIIVGADESELLVEDGVRTAVPAGSTIEFGTYPIRVEHS